LKLALAQLNPTIGDLAGNTKLVAEAARDAKTQSADLLVASELIISGYPPKDLLLREGFAEACDRSVRELAAELKDGPAILVGHPTQDGLPAGRIANAASLLVEGQVAATIHKTLLPNYDVFDERRYFRPAESTEPIEFRGTKLGVHICEDAWWGEPATPHHSEPSGLVDPVARLVDAGADVLLNLSASPFERHKHELRQDIIRRHTQRFEKPFVFVNQVGGNDDLVFDGSSFVLDTQGRLAFQLPAFESSLAFLDLNSLSPFEETGPADAFGEMLDALILGLRDYVRKCGFTDCVLGLSGGIDSTLACYIAAKAVGAEHVHGIAMPSRHSSQHSIDDARALAENLGVHFDVIPIEEMHKAFEATSVVGEDLTSQPSGLADQNLQARIRGNIVMTRSNRRGWMALATGNKSELAVGYCTLYGDMCGGFAVLADIFKRDVYGISRYINDVREQREVLPAGTITKPPSAELAPDQLDQDTLPEYPVLDGILEGLIEREESVATVSKQFPRETVEWVATRLNRNEFKRRQMPPGIKLSARAFGSGRRMPMAAQFDQ
jgi:NAD+ synthase (glutamine-hydrolysing)